MVIQPTGFLLLGEKKTRRILLKIRGIRFQEIGNFKYPPSCGTQRHRFSTRQEKMFHPGRSQCPQNPIFQEIVT